MASVWAVGAAMASVAAWGGGQAPLHGHGLDLALLCQDCLVWESVKQKAQPSVLREQ